MKTKKPYCVQNGDCETCSLVNYGRDCRNIPIENADDEPVTIAVLTQGRFQSEMIKAGSMQRLEPARTEYWVGYQRGLRRAFHGPSFGTPGDHALWLAALTHADAMRRQRGQGYRDGLKGQSRDL